MVVYFLINSLVLEKSSMLISSRFFDESNFPALFPNLFRTKKSTENFNLAKSFGDPSRSKVLFAANNIFFYRNLPLSITEADPRWRPIVLLSSQNWCEIENRKPESGYRKPEINLVDFCYYRIFFIKNVIFKQASKHTVINYEYVFIKKVVVPQKSYPCRRMQENHVIKDALKQIVCVHVLIIACSVIKVINTFKWVECLDNNINCVCELMETKFVTVLKSARFTKEEANNIVFNGKIKYQRNFFFFKLNEYFF